LKHSFYVHLRAKSSGPAASYFGKIGYSNQEACHAKRKRRQSILLSNAAVSAARVTRPKPRLNEAHELCTAKRNSLKSSAEMICARAVLRAGFKRCCMKAGKRDGANRAYFF
jgi:hypothetical protein